MQVNTVKDFVNLLIFPYVESRYSIPAFKIRVLIVFSSQMGNQIMATLQAWGLSSNVVAELSPHLVEVHRAAQERHYMVLTAAAKAYFRFLKISQGVSFEESIVKLSHFLLFQYRLTYDR